MDISVIISIGAGIVTIAVGIIGIWQMFHKKNRTKVTPNESDKFYSNKTNYEEENQKWQLLPPPKASKIEFFKNYLKENQIVVQIHNNLEPEWSDLISHWFSVLNQKTGKKYYSSKRFRVIRKPEYIDSIPQLKLDVAPIRYEFIALMKDKTANSDPDFSDVRTELSKILNKANLKSPFSKKGDFETNNFNLLGSLVCLITNDNPSYTLLRKRGGGSLTAPNKWDVSFGGHPREKPEENKEIIDLTQSILMKKKEKLEILLRIQPTFFLLVYILIKNMVISIFYPIGRLKNP